MGVSESKVVIETLSAACTEAEKNEKDNIDAPLTNKKFTAKPLGPDPRGYQEKHWPAPVRQFPDKIPKKAQERTQFENNYP
ncbi:unnamed protein product [Penicillium palitans]|nr:hypothetical protein NUH16_004652 [Penicillium rubens]